MASDAKVFYIIKVGDNIKEEEDMKEMGEKSRNHDGEGIRKTTSGCWATLKVVDINYVVDITKGMVDTGVHSAQCIICSLRAYLTSRLVDYYLIVMI